MGFQGQSSGESSSSVTAKLKPKAFIEHFSEKGPVEIREYLKSGDKDRELFDAAINREIDSNALAKIYSKSNLPISYKQFNPTLGLNMIRVYINNLKGLKHIDLLCEFISKIDAPELWREFLAIQTVHRLDGLGVMAEIFSDSEKLKKVISDRLAYEYLTNRYNGTYGDYAEELRHYPDSPSNDEAERALFLWFSSPTEHIYFKPSADFKNESTTSNPGKLEIIAGYTKEKSTRSVYAKGYRLPYSRPIQTFIFSKLLKTDAQRTALLNNRADQDLRRSFIEFFKQFVKDDYPRPVFKPDYTIFESFKLIAPAIDSDQVDLSVISDLIKIEYQEAVLVIMQQCSMSARYKIYNSITQKAWGYLKQFPQEEFEFMSKLLKLMNERNSVVLPEVACKLFERAYGVVKVSPVLLEFADLHFDLLMSNDSSQLFMHAVANCTRELLIEKSDDFDALWKPYEKLENLKKFIVRTFVEKQKLILLKFKGNALHKLYSSMEGADLIENFRLYLDLNLNHSPKDLMTIYDNFPVIRNVFNEFVSQNVNLFIMLFDKNIADATRVFNSMSDTQKSNLWSKVLLSHLLNTIAGLDVSREDLDTLVTLDQNLFNPSGDHPDSIIYFDTSGLRSSWSCWRATVSETYSRKMKSIRAEAMVILDGLLKLEREPLDLSWQNSSYAKLEDLFLGLGLNCSRELKDKILKHLSKDVLKKFIRLSTGIEEQRFKVGSRSEWLIEKGVLQRASSSWALEHDLLSYLNGPPIQEVPATIELPPSLPVLPAPTAPLAPPEYFAYLPHEAAPVLPVERVDACVGTDPIENKSELSALTAQIQNLSLVVQTMQVVPRPDAGQEQLIQNLREENQQAKNTIEELKGKNKNLQTQINTLRFTLNSSEKNTTPATKLKRRASFG